MARKERRRNVRPSVAPPSVARPRPRPVTASAAPAVDPVQLNADLVAAYGHVARDLRRILVTALVLFGVIVVSRYFL